MLAGTWFMAEMHFKQHVLTYSGCGTFTKNKERLQKFNETGDSRYISQNQLVKASFQHDKVNWDS